MNHKGARQRLFWERDQESPCSYATAARGLGQRGLVGGRRVDPGPSLPYTGDTQTFPHMPLQHLKSLTHWWSVSQWLGGLSIRHWPVTTGHLPGFTLTGKSRVTGQRLCAFCTTPTFWTQPQPQPSPPRENHLFSIPMAMSSFPRPLYPLKAGSRSSLTLGTLSTQVIGCLVLTGQMAAICLLI